MEDLYRFSIPFSFFTSYLYTTQLSPFKGGIKGGLVRSTTTEEKKLIRTTEVGR